MWASASVVFAIGVIARFWRRGRSGRALVATLAATAILTCATPALACSTGDPAWSPDGRWIAFAGSADPNTSWTIQLVDAAGTQVRPVTTKPPDHPPSLVWTHDFEPTWSPDARLLAYVSGFEFWNSGYSHSLDGWQIGVRALASGAEWRAGQGLDPRWSSTMQLAWSTFEGPYNDPAGFVAGPLAVSGNGGDPSWSPGGSRIVYDMDGALWIRRADGRGRSRRLVPGEEPHWSPDGRLIAYFRGDTLRFVAPEARRPIALSLGRPSDVEPVWSPDGTRIALGTSILNVRTGRVRELDAPLGDYPGPSWSPDGRWLVYAAHGLTIVPATGGPARTIDPCALDRAGAG
jgi:Tol biopolymer transport system component